MKKINYVSEFKGADGQPFTVIDPDVKKQRKAREDAKKEGLESWPAPQIDCTFAEAMVWFMNHIPFSDELDKDGKPKPPRNLTPEDAGNAYAVIKAFQAPDDKGKIVEMEDAVYSWLLKILGTDGIPAFKPIATYAIVLERLQDLIKEDKTK